MSSQRFPFRFGKYIILDRISSGGMAEVFRAKTLASTSLERFLAIKRMLPGVMRDPQFVPMFIDEAKLAAQLNHPNIVQTYELAASEDGLFIAMELLLGKDLKHIARVVRERGLRLDHGFVAYVASKAAEGLDFAHRATSYDGTPLNLVHRDVSPQNVMVTYDGHVKLVDFGVAKADIKTTKTLPGVLKGKLAYMSPEQVIDGVVDRRSDVFALGVVLWELLAGEELFSGDSAFAILEKIRNVEIPALRTKAPEVSEELAAVVHRALARDASARFQSAAEMGEALTPFLIGNRTIFGPKQAAELMRTTFSRDIEETQRDLASYRRIVDADCFDEVPDTSVSSRPTLDTGMHTTPGTDPPMARDSAVIAIAERLASDPERPTVEDPVPPVSPDTAAAVLNEVAAAAHTEFHLTAEMSTVVGTARGAALTTDPPPRASRRTIFQVAGALLLGALVVAAGLGLRRSSEPDSALASDRPAAVEIPATPRAAGPGAATTPPGVPAPSAQPEAAQARVPERGGAPEPGGARAPLHGYISVRAETDKPALVYVDGRELGYSPVFSARVKLGVHQLKVVEVENDVPGAQATQEIRVGPDHRRSHPLRVVLTPGT